MPGNSESKSSHRNVSVNILARVPVVGEVKTRLIPAIGADGAMRAHTRMLNHAVATAASAKVGPVILWGTPTAKSGVFASLQQTHKIELRTQTPGDLGAKMRSPLLHAMAEVGAGIVIGCDCPELRPGDLHDAAAALTDNDVVLGPAFDGGYYLVGATTDYPRMFEDIAWGGEDVLETTRERLREGKVRWQEITARGGC